MKDISHTSFSKLNRILSKSLMGLLLTISLLCGSVEYLIGQYVNKEVIVTTEYDLKLVGTVIGENDNDLILKLKTVNDTLALHEEAISQIELVTKETVLPKKEKVSEHNTDYNSDYKSDADDFEVKITTKGNSTFVGLVVSENEDQVKLSLSEIRDTIILHRNIIHDYEIIDEHNTWEKALTGESFVVIITEDDSRLVGDIIDESGDEIDFYLHSNLETVSIKKAQIKRISIRKPSVQAKWSFKKLLAKSKKPKRVTYKYKNGSSFRGHALIDNDSIVAMRLSGTGERLTLQKKHMLHYLHRDEVIMLRKGRYHRKLGYVNGVSISHNFSWEGTSTQIQFLRYKMIHPSLGIGGGMGYHNLYSNQFRTMNLGDLFAYGKLYATHGKARLYIDAQLGFAVPLEKKSTRAYTWGPKLQPSIGLEFASRKRGRFLISINQFWLLTRHRSNSSGSTDAVISEKYLSDTRSLGVSFIRNM